MPHAMWKINFKCVGCKHPHDLTSKGLYKTVRMILGVRDYYYIGCEYLFCKHCGQSYRAFDRVILDQLPYGVRCLFPAVLTYK